MLKKLNEMKIGEFGVIKRVEGEGKIKRRLYDMGITPGADVFFRKKAPLGDPIEITIRGYELTLRKVEASNVELEVQNEKVHNPKKIFAKLKRKNNQNTYENLVALEEKK